MHAPAVRLVCEACGDRYTQPITVTRKPCPNGVRVTVEVDEAEVTAWAASHRAPVVIPTKACA